MFVPGELSINWSTLPDFSLPSAYAQHHFTHQVRSLYELVRGVSGVVVSVCLHGAHGAPLVCGGTSLPSCSASVPPRRRKIRSGQSVLVLLLLSSSLVCPIRAGAVGKGRRAASLDVPPCHSSNLGSHRTLISTRMSNRTTRHNERRFHSVERYDTCPTTATEDIQRQPWTS